MLKGDARGKGVPGEPAWTSRGWRLVPAGPIDRIGPQIRLHRTNRAALLDRAAELAANQAAARRRRRLAAKAESNCNSSPGTKRKRSVRG